MEARKLLREGTSVLLAAAVALVARASLADHYRVPSGSMEPTVAVGDQICVDKRAYGLRVPASRTYIARTHEPARGDVVVLTSPEDGEVLLKRVVATPGDLVQVWDGHVLIGGRPAPWRVTPGGAIEELGGVSHGVGTSFGGGPDFGPVLVPPDAYLVLGDNRGNSNDGRSFGWVSRGAILGRAVAVCVHDDALVWKGL